MLFLQLIIGPLIFLPALETAVSYLKALASLLLHKILPPYSMRPDSGVCRDEMLLNGSVVVLVAVVIIHLLKYCLNTSHGSFQSHLS